MCVCGASVCGGVRAASVIKGNGLATLIVGCIEDDNDYEDDKWGGGERKKERKREIVSVCVRV